MMLDKCKCKNWEIFFNTSFSQFGKRMPDGKLSTVNIGNQVKEIKLPLLYLAGSEFAEAC